MMIIVYLLRPVIKSLSLVRSSLNGLLLLDSSLKLKHEREKGKNLFKRSETTHTRVNNLNSNGNLTLWR